MRFGLAGTGYWARIAHAAALASTPGVSLAAVWGRNLDAAGTLAAEHGAAGFSDVGAFLDAVDAVAFAVPPDVQAPLAVRAAEAGKHLLLEKPVALSGSDADKLVDAVDAAGVASVVFFTHQFNTEIRAWLADERARGADGGWSGGVAVWLGAALQPDSPFNTPWRRDKGGLWDLGPHVVAMLWACLGPVTSVTAVAGGTDVTHLVLRHSGGASSAATVTLSAPPPAAGNNLFVWGEAGRSVMPAMPDDPVDAVRVAALELVASAESGRPHPLDVRFGRDVVRVLADAQAQLEATALQTRAGRPR
jgi:predicted dehydrogenase